MIEKLDLRENVEIIPIKGSCHDDCLAKSSVLIKINELVDAVNKLKTMAKNTNTVLESLVEENNVHEKQIDELQMKLEPEKCETPAENMLDKFSEQREWIGKLCRFWDDSKYKNCAKYDILIDIDEDDEYPFVVYSGGVDINYRYCEPVLPTDNAIYKGE